MAGNGEVSVRLPRGDVDGQANRTFDVDDGKQIAHDSANRYAGRGIAALIGDTINGARNRE
jgi:hypothetical protein